MRRLKERVAGVVFAFALLLAGGFPALAQENRTVALPEGTACTLEILTKGVWKLVDVAEARPGVETAAFAAEPHQYIRFGKNNVFYKVKSDQRIKGRKNVIEAMRRGDARDVEQYVLNESGVLFFYKQSVAYDALNCRVVSQPLGKANVGNVVLYPPGQAAVALLKTYRPMGKQKNQ